MLREIGWNGCPGCGDAAGLGLQRVALGAQEGQTQAHPARRDAVLRGHVSWAFRVGLGSPGRGQQGLRGSTWGLGLEPPA